MSAANTDLLKKLSRRWVGQIGAGGVADASVTTVPLASTTNLPTDTAVVVTIDRVDSSGTATSSLEETVIGVVSGSNLVSCTRGVEGTAQAHSAGAVVEILVTAKSWNDLVDMLLVQHNQLGYHTNITACNITASGTTTASHVSASDITARVVNVNSIAAIDASGYAAITKALRSATTTVDVSAATAPSSGQVLTATGTTAATWQTPTTAATDGWQTSADTWVYASASTFTIAGVDRTAIFTKGTRLKFTNSTLKYAVVVSSSFSTDTTVTIAVNTDYVIANAAISSPFYSYQASPAGYPGSFAFTTTYAGFSANPTPPTKFSVIGNQVTVVFGAANEGTSNATTLTMTVPITSVNVSGQAYKYLGRSVDNGTENIGISSLPANSATLTCSKTTDGSAWTGSGTKAWQGVVTYYI